MDPLPVVLRRAAGTLTTIWVEERYVVARIVVLFHLPWSCLAKPVPVRVMKVSGLPCGAEVGVRAARTGLTANVAADDQPPPGLEFRTRTWFDLATLRRLAGIVAVICVAETQVLESGV